MPELNTTWFEKGINDENNVAFPEYGLTKEGAELLEKVFEEYELNNP